MSTTIPVKQVPFLVFSDAAHTLFTAYSKASFEKRLKDPIFRAGAHVAFISQSALAGFVAHQKAWGSGRIWAGAPIICYTADKYHERRISDNPKTGMGLYYDAELCFFVDDLEEWSHGRREFKDVRTARDLAIELTGNNNVET